MGNSVALTREARAKLRWGTATPMPIVHTASGIPTLGTNGSSNLDDDGSTSAMIALVPMTSDWCTLDLPHLTLVYAGDISNLPVTAYNELAKDAASIAMMSSTIQLRVKGVEQFGKDAESVDALTLVPSPELWAMRRFVERWNKSDYSVYRPHCTIGPPGSGAKLMCVPGALAFNRIMVGWGTDSITFNMQTPRY